MSDEKQAGFGICCVVLSSWLFGFGYIFVQALDNRIPELELNAIRLGG